ncbi:hypothetical protein [Deinococcus pimensis]|uniref:hypothetical protein n=1 Tax=Deinococcus pimensis TaxID=309888 RepID=UPI00048716D5|nr:hypothetical protein [Deinococcus pimensis]
MKRPILVLVVLPSVLSAAPALAQSSLPGQPSQTGQNLTQRPVLSGKTNGVRWALFAPGAADANTDTPGAGLLSLTAPQGAGVLGARYDAAAKVATLSYRVRGTLADVLAAHDEQLKRQGFAPTSREVNAREARVTYGRGEGRLTLNLGLAGSVVRAALDLSDVRGVAPDAGSATPPANPQDRAP